MRRRAKGAAPGRGSNDKQRRDVYVGTFIVGLAISGVIGFFFMPRTVGLTLEEIETQHGTA